jgi:hypothetical protein
MSSDRSIVDIIERATDSNRYCDCGRNTTAVWHDDQVWLECVSLTEAPPASRIRRLVRAVTASAHVRQSIIDLPQVA